MHDTLQRPGGAAGVICQLLWRSLGAHLWGTLPCSSLLRHMRSFMMHDCTAACIGPTACGAGYRHTHAASRLLTCTVWWTHWPDGPTIAATMRGGTTCTGPATGHGQLAPLCMHVRPLPMQTPTAQTHGIVRGCKNASAAWPQECSCLGTRTRGGPSCRCLLQLQTVPARSAGAGQGRGRRPDEILEANWLWASGKDGTGVRSLQESVYHSLHAQVCLSGRGLTLRCGARMY